MKIWTLTWMIILLSVVIIILSLALYLSIAAILSYWGTNPKKLNCTTNQTIFLSSNGMHIDLIMATNMLPSYFLSNLSPMPTTRYYAIGWGDKGFYLETPSWPELKLSTAMNAMLINSATAMHVTQYQNIQSHWVPISVCQEQIEILNEYITTTFQLDPSGAPIEILGVGKTPDDRFYEAKGCYTGLKTCNIWVSEGLKKASIKTARWSPFVYGIIHHAEKQAGESDL